MLQLCSGCDSVLRLQVFQIEQGFDPEFDELDKDSAIHFVAELPASIAREHDAQMIEGEYHAVAAGRIYQVLYRPDADSKPDRPTYPLEMVFSLGRVCCLKAFRGHGLGNIILKKMMDTAQRLGANRLTLHSQADKTGFYLKHGFAVVQHECKDWCFDEDGQPHVGMQLTCGNLY